ncbi:hypothetical protein K2173_024836 [Erythroxylum novogranatense]|uniref:Uncharacterized protein n=1 Tax=Erythroxylum novogranatense TaxID=1862640 RepID=A0AAV8UFB4_9ROSI|nr:hypothetical protein K2173_024836 [Erythroxylum novogranatense]
MSSVFGWLLNFLLLMAVIGIVGFQLLNLSDLETDYINPYDSANQINSVVLPEYVIQGLLCMSFLFTGHWFMCLLSLPYLYYNLRLYTRRQHLVDVTEFYNQVNREKQQRLFKLGYLIILLVISIFWLLWTVLEEED